MKISNSKKQLAKIISENGGWRKTAEFSAQDFDGDVFFYHTKPSRDEGVWRHNGVLGGDWINCGKALPNWHQTIVSRDEYFHLYPVPDAELVAMLDDVTKENKHPEYCESVMRTIPEPSDKPTIEQLAADYKAKLEIAQQAQEEADFRRGEAEAALSRLEIACLAIDLEVKPASAQAIADAEPKINITDWRDLQVGDEVECVSPNVRKDYYTGKVGVLVEMDDSHTPLLVQFDGGARIWCHEVKFIRRP